MNLENYYKRLPVVDNILLSKTSDKYCMMSPTHPPHFKYASRLMSTIEKFLTNIDEKPFFVLDTKDQEKNFCVSVNCNKIELLFLQTLLKEHKNYFQSSNIDLKKGKLGLPVPDSSKYYSGKLGPNDNDIIENISTQTTTWTRRYQILKKWLGVHHLWLKRGCKITWVMDSESVFIRKLDFKNFVHSFDVTPWLNVWPSVLPHVKNKIPRCWGNIGYGNSTSMHIFMGVSPEKWDITKACNYSRPYYEDLWLYDGNIINDLLKHLEKVHYPRSITNLILNFEHGMQGEYHYYGNWILMKKFTTDDYYYKRYILQNLIDELYTKHYFIYKKSINKKILPNTMSGFIKDALHYNKDWAKIIVPIMNNMKWINFLGWRNQLWNKLDILCTHKWNGSVCFSNCEFSPHYCSQLT